MKDVKKEIKKTEIVKDAGYEKKKPDYAIDGVAVWINKGKYDKEYLTIKMIGHNTINVPKKY